MQTTIKKGNLLTQERFLRTTYGDLKDINKGKLSDEDAISYKNFWLGHDGKHRYDLHAHYPFDSHKRLYKDLLSSDAASINFFLFIKHNKNDPGILKFLGYILCLNNSLKAIESLEFGYPISKYGLLNEAVKFHVYLKVVTLENIHIGVGFSLSLLDDCIPKPLTQNIRSSTVCSKYSINKEAVNLDYPFDFQTHPFYKDHVPFINRHLLAFTLASRKKLDQFQYIHMFSEKNDQQYDAAKAFQDVIVAPLKETFMLLDFETFIGVGSVCLKNNENAIDWLTYLRCRYFE